MFSAHLEAKEALPGNVSRETPSLCTPSALLQLSESPQKGAYTLIRSFDFCNCHPGDTSRSPGPEASRDYNCDLTGLCTLTAAT